jgi:transposase InsO family protein
VTRRLRVVGIRDKPIAAGTPWQNGYAERLIGTIRRECVDHVIVFGEAHLRRILGEFAAYYNESRTHRALSKDAPVHRAIERLGDITYDLFSDAFITNLAVSEFSAHTGLFAGH